MFLLGDAKKNELVLSASIELEMSTKMNWVTLNIASVLWIRRFLEYTLFFFSYVETVRIISSKF